MSDPRWFTILPAAVVAAAGPAHATTYLTTQAAQKLMFPAASAFVDRSVTFTPGQRKAIVHLSGVSTQKGQAIWEAKSGNARLGWFIVDRVLGKHELITYAVALDPSGTVHGVEILDYRETYGGEIRNERWRRQFVGKRQGAALKLDKDIKNISGATLSCRHVTDGIKRLLATYDLLLKNA